VDIVSGHHVPVAVTRSLVTLGLPVVETLHNTFAWYGPDEWAAERERAELVTDAVAVSETVSSYYDRHTGYRPRHVVPNAVHPGRVTAVPKSFARRMLGVAGEGPVFVSVGRLAPQKNLPGLLAAFSRVHREYPEARLLLAGPKHPGVSLSTLRRTHTAIFTSGAVRWLETRRDVGTVLSAADAYVSAAFYEGWSVAASEAAWIGLPLLLSDVGGAPELVGRASGPGDGPRGRVVANPCGDPLAVDDAAIAMQAAEARAAHEVELAEAMKMVAADRRAWHARAEDIRAWARTAVAPSTFAARYAAVLDGAFRRQG
jgi:glycosyltransferase involved in cell wall biosynthesis